MRDLSRRSAEAYVAQREALGFPWLEKPVSVPSVKNENAQPELSSGGKAPDKADLLVEIGTEELPAMDLEKAYLQLQTLVPEVLADLRLEYQDVKIYATPRRLAAHIIGLAGKQAEVTQEVKGPPADRAFDKDGKLTPAGAGFARSKGVDEKDLVIKEVDGGKYVTAVVTSPGYPCWRSCRKNWPTWFPGYALTNPCAGIPAASASQDRSAG